MKMSENDKRIRDYKQQVINDLIDAFNYNDHQKIEHLLEVIVNDKTNGVSYTLTMKTIWNILNSAEIDEELFVRVVDVVGKCDDDKEVKKYAGSTKNEKNINFVKSLINSPLSLKGILYTYMNSSFRDKIVLDYFLKEIIACRKISEEDCIKELAGYWFRGEVKKISENQQWIRIAPFNTGLERLISVNVDKYKITNDNGMFIEPYIGMKLYFKLKDYNASKSQFTAHYLCSDYNVIEETW